MVIPAVVIVVYTAALCRIIFCVSIGIVYTGPHEQVKPVRNIVLYGKKSLHAVLLVHVLLVFKGPLDLIVFNHRRPGGAAIRNGEKGQVRHPTQRGVLSSISFPQGWQLSHVLTKEIMNKTLLFSKEIINEKVKELASKISLDYKEKEPIFIGVLNGAVFFLSDLVREVGIPLRMDFVRASSYGSEMESSGSVRLIKDIEIPVQGKPVILVEDIVDTGLTLSYIRKHLELRHPESIKICALIDKLERRETSIPVDYFGFKIEEGFVVGYGLDYDEKYRNLPDIYVLK